MRIARLTISNFRAIDHVDLQGLADTVVIAGPNGCGKSCVFDAIRLVKSVYGGYQRNEWQSWFGEFQINVNKPTGDLSGLFQAKDRPIEVTAIFALSAAEQAHLRRLARELLTELVWKEVAPESASWRSIDAAPLAANLRVHQPEVERLVAENLPGLLTDIELPFHTARVTIAPDGRVDTAPSRMLELVFSHYDPQHIGIIDYHGPTRNYGREQLGGINLSIESSEDRLRQHALYNYANKYANLKTEMAASYVRHLLARQANPEAALDDSLSSTLKELFATFFPGKEFLGPQPTDDGRLLFRVRTPSGSEHDIDDLSSGEKEVLYGYLRLRNSSPRHSVLLIDEPELHLNPRLISGLASFYHRHLGVGLGNQLWLVTHSDTLIREAVGQSGFSVLHMQPAGRDRGANQASPIEAAEDLQRAVIDLVGDLAAYRPGAKIVVFEGAGDSQFDVRMVCTLFPHFQSVANPISGGNKRRVAQLYGLLDDARQAGHIPGSFYAVTDADGEPVPGGGAPTVFAWDVYHIENYLLAPEFIHRVLVDLNRAVGDVETVPLVSSALKSCARETVPSLVIHQLQGAVNKALLPCLAIRVDPDAVDAAAAMADAVRRSEQRVSAEAAGKLTAGALGRMADDVRAQANEWLGTDQWRSRLRGRDVLRRFVGRYGGGVAYEVFRDLVIARMRDLEYQPIGMGQVLNKILSHRLV